MEQILGWGTAGGLGIFLAGFGIFLWSLQFMPREYWRRGRWTKKEESKK